MKIYKCDVCLVEFDNPHVFGGHYSLHRFKLEELKKDRSRRLYLIREFGHYCWVCKNNTWNDQLIPLEIDHIDGNPNNNIRENLRVICPNCHAQTPTYKAKNAKRNKISNRQKFYKSLKERKGH